MKMELCDSRVGIHETDIWVPEIRDILLNLGHRGSKLKRHANGNSFNILITRITQHLEKLSRAKWQGQMIMLLCNWDFEMDMLFKHFNSK